MKKMEYRKPKLVKLESGKNIIFPDIMPVFKNAPKGFVNDVRGWTFTKEEVKQAYENKSLLTLDLDMAGKGVCSLHCSHCFRRTSSFWKEIRYDQKLESIIREAKELGLKTVKLIGPGEPLQDKTLLPLLKLLHQLDITTLIFTKAWVIGNDDVSKKIHNVDGYELADMLYKYGASLLVGTTSFNPETENELVGVEYYHNQRHEAILRLVELGFNKFIENEATRMAFIMAPILPTTIDEAFEIYKYARERNIQPVMTPTMVAGLALNN